MPDRKTGQRVNRKDARAEATANLAIEGIIITDEDNALLDKLEALNVSYDEGIAYLIQTLPKRG